MEWVEWKETSIFVPWTDEDEDKLDTMKKKEIDLNDAALERLINVQNQEHKAAFLLSSRDEQRNTKAVKRHP